MDVSAALTTLTDDERVTAVLDEIEVVRQWSRYALVRRRETGDEEIWSMRAGHPWSPVVARIPAAVCAGFVAGHRRREERLWTSIVEAAGNCSAAISSAAPAAASRAARGESGGRGGEASTARWTLARALRQYARAARAPRTAVPAATRRSVLASWEASGRRCGICGGEVVGGAATALDHILPVSMGGENAAENLRVAHATCNRRRSAWLWDGAPIGAVRIELEPDHPSPCAVFACWFCGVPTRGYIDLPGLPVIRLCDDHRQLDNVLSVLAGYGLPLSALDRLKSDARDGGGPDGT